MNDGRDTIVGDRWGTPAYSGFFLNYLIVAPVCRSFSKISDNPFKFQQLAHTILQAAKLTSSPFPAGSVSVQSLVNCILVNLKSLAF